MTDTQQTAAAVASELNRRSIPATYEYPGFIHMPIDGWAIDGGTDNGKWDCDVQDPEGINVAVAKSAIPADSGDVQAISDFLQKSYDTVTSTLLSPLRTTHKPHRLAKDSAGDQWEFISWPYAMDGKLAINIRVPGDPTSMIVAEARLMTPEGHNCSCADAGRDYYLSADHYRERSQRLQKCPALLRR